MSESRTVNTKRNIVSGIIKQCFTILLPFIIRTIVLYTLGAEYQGISGLFTSILQVLNLTELGFSSAVMYILYKPVAQKDTVAICAIISYLKRVYYIVGGVVIGVGIILLPFIPHLISGGYPDDINIYLIFGVYLLNSSLSYLLFGYKSVLLNAMQREDIVSNIATFSMALMRILQIVVLLLFKNYYIFTIVLLIGTTSNNFLLEYYSNKFYPSLKPKGIIHSEQKAELTRQIKGIFADRLGDVARNSFDNIVLSSILGLTMVAIYDNYYYIYTAIYGIMIVVTRAMQASVGNSIVLESKEKNQADLNKFTFLFMIAVGWCSICLACLYQPFMRIWMRGNTDLMLSNQNMFLFVIYFYSINMNNTRNLYLQGRGLYIECMIWFIIEAGANLLLNILLGKLFGVTGIIIATIITILAFNFIARTQILFKYYFMVNPLQFYLSHIYYLLITLVICVITYLLSISIPGIGILSLLIKMVISFVLPLVLYFFIYRNQKAGREALAFISHLVRGK